MLFGNFAEAQSRNFEEVIDEGFSEDYGYWSDSDLEDEEDESGIPQSVVAEDATQLEVHDPTDSPAILSEGKIVYEDHKECVKQGKVVKIPDVAFVT